MSSLFPGPSHLLKMAAAFQSKLKVFTARFYYVSHGNATITCYEETFRELGAVKLSPSANRKPLRYENEPRAGASSIVACLVLIEFRRMFIIVCNEGRKTERAERMERTNWQTLQKKVYNTKHRLIRPDIRYRRNSMFKVATNIGTGTVDYWLWIMDQKLRANLDNK